MSRIVRLQVRPNPGALDSFSTFLRYNVELTEAPRAAVEAADAAVSDMAVAVYWTTRTFNTVEDKFELTVTATDVPARRLASGRYLLSSIALGRLLRVLIDKGYDVKLAATRDILERFRSWFIKWKPTKGIPYEPRRYQLEAAETAASNHFSVILLPTGAGKTFVAALVLRRLRLPALVLAPTKELVEQWKRRLRGYGVPAGDLASNAPVKVATYQMVARRGAPVAAVLVLDEAHHAPAETWRRPLLDNPWHTIIALTATMERGDDNTDVFRKLATWYEKSFRELADQGYLAPVRLHVLALNAEGLAESLLEMESKARDWRQYRSRAMILYESAVTPRLAEAAAALASGGRKVLLFLDYVADVEKAYSVVEEKVPAWRIHGRLRKDERLQALDEFSKARHGVLVVSPAGNEGIDIPDADVAVMPYLPNRLRFRQRVGRVVRPRPGKVAEVYIAALDVDGGVWRYTRYAVRLGLAVWQVRRMLEKREASYYGVEEVGIVRYEELVGDKNRPGGV